MRDGGSSEHKSPTRRQIIIGAAATVAAGTIIGKSIPVTPDQKFPATATTKPEPTLPARTETTANNAEPYLDKNPFKEQFPGMSPHGEFISNPSTSTTPDRQVKMLPYPDEFITVEKFKVGIAGADAMVIRKYPSATKYNELKKVVDPDTIDPSDVVFLRISGEDFEEASRGRLNNTTIGAWYMATKAHQTSDSAWHFNPINLLTKQPLKKGELPDVVTKNMFIQKGSINPRPQALNPSPTGKV